MKPSVYDRRVLLTRLFYCAGCAKHFPADAQLGFTRGPARTCEGCGKIVYTAVVVQGAMPTVRGFKKRGPQPAAAS